MRLLHIKNRVHNLLQLSFLILILHSLSTFGQQSSNVSKSDVISAFVEISFPEVNHLIDPMIYGQMLENVNDSVIYNGVVSANGVVRENLIQMLTDLKIPIIRWPGGTVVHEYHWRNGVGPRNLRPEVKTFAWNGKETYQFGTDEFLNWCRLIGTKPYINLNMGNDPEYGGTLNEALDWIEYVNGACETTNLGIMRGVYAQKQSYNVSYWCIGNENYGPFGKHTAETAFGYSDRLKLWANSINQRFPDLKLLGVGHLAEWNKVVLERAGSEIDFLTQHYYVASRFKGDRIEEPYNSLFAPVKMERHIQLIGDYLTLYNRKLNRMDNPIKLSIDEWNNRHSIFNGIEFVFTRQAPRRQLDAAVAATMLQVFIRNSDVVGMANYIFPVNGHGLIRTNGDDDAFKSPLYYIFDKYRHAMVGKRLNAIVSGDAIATSQITPSIDGDCSEIVWGGDDIPFVDAAACQTETGEMNVALVNRSIDNKAHVSLKLPDGYYLNSIWKLESNDINQYISVTNRDAIQPKVIEMKKGDEPSQITIAPCGITVLHFGQMRN